MHNLDHNGAFSGETCDFPFEFHHVESTHPSYIMAFHWHPEYELIRILKGSMDITLNEKKITAIPGEIVLIPSGVLHSGIPRDCIYQCLIFDIDVFLGQNPVCAEYIQKLTGQDTRVCCHFTEEHPAVRSAADRIFDAIWKQVPGYELIVFGQFYYFFGLIFSNHCYFEKGTQNRREDKRIRQLKQVLDFIEHHYASPLTLQQLSDSVSMSPKYFCRFFSEMTGQTPMDYLNHRRIEQACHELCTTQDSITEIAARNGFHDLSYFIRTFKKYTGITPGKYKKRLI